MLINISKFSISFTHRIEWKQKWCWASAHAVNYNLSSEKKANLGDDMWENKRDTREAGMKLLPVTFSKIRLFPQYFHFWAVYFLASL